MLQHPHPPQTGTPATDEPISPQQAAIAACRRLLEINAKNGSGLAFIARQRGFKKQLEKVLELAEIACTPEISDEPALAVLGPGGDFTRELREGAAL